MFACCQLLGSSVRHTRDAALGARALDFGKTETGANHFISLSCRFWSGSEREYWKTLDMLRSSGPSPEAGWAPDPGSAPPPRHRPSEQPGRARRRLWRGARVKADDPGACREPCLLSWAVGPAGLGDQKLMLSRPLPQVWCNPRAQARTVSQDKCQRKPPGWSGSHSTGAAWSSETLRDTTEPRLAGDRSRPFLCPLSLCISTRVPHLPPPGALQAFRGGLLRPLGLSAHGE